MVNYEDHPVTVTPASSKHLDGLLKIENACFKTDHLSRRSFKRFLISEQSVFLVALENDQVIAYCLIIFHRGTRLARLYSIAVLPEHRGKKIARTLITQGEIAAQSKGAIYFRLEVNTHNTAAIDLYHSLGFKEFHLIKNYYQDQSDALRMQKRIRQYQHASVHTPIPWFKQSTPFTCGPAALMMAMSALDQHYQVNIEEELTLWREATTIYMTSGHGGCHPLGLALSAKLRGYKAQVWINNTEPLFIDGVRSDEKKNIIATVHYHFVSQAKVNNIPVNYENMSIEQLKQVCDSGAVPIVLISTYRMDNKKAPHWVVVSGYDERCFYLHDPYPNETEQDQMDCQYMPIAHEDFERMSVFGANRMRTLVIIS